MAANDYSKYTRHAIEQEDIPVYDVPKWPKPGDPTPDEWFDAGRRRRIHEFRKILPA